MMTPEPIRRDYRRENETAAWKLAACAFFLAVIFTAVLQ